MEIYIDALTSYIPAEVDLLAMLKFLALFSFGALFIGLLGRVVLGQRSNLNHAVSSAMGILFLYALAIVIYTFDPADLAKYLAPLPFAAFSGETLYLFSFTALDFTAICSQVLSMVILAFLVNLLDTFIPKGKKILGWYLWRFVSVILSIVLHIAASWAITTYLPDTLVIYAPIILLGILVVMLMLGLLKALLGLVLTITNPILGALYTFFFANSIGKQLSKAVLTTVLLCAVVYALEYFGYAAIDIGATALGNYVPLLFVLLVLWYLIGHVL